MRIPLNDLIKDISITTSYNSYNHLQVVTIIFTATFESVNSKIKAKVYPHQIADTIDVAPRVKTILDDTFTFFIKERERIEAIKRQMTLFKVEE